MNGCPLINRQNVSEYVLNGEEKKEREITDSEIGGNEIEEGK